MNQNPNDPFAIENRVAKSSPQERMNMERVKELYPEDYKIVTLASNVPYTGNWDLRGDFG